MESNIESHINEGEYSQQALWTLPNFQTGVKRLFYTEHKATSTDYSNSIDFYIGRKKTKYYIYPKASKIYLKCKVTMPDESKCMVDDYYVLINLLSSTLFKDMIVSIQEK